MDMMIIHHGSCKKRDIAVQLGPNLISNFSKHATCLALCIKSRHRERRVLYSTPRQIKVACLCAICVAADQFNYCTLARLHLQSLSLRAPKAACVYLHKRKTLSIGLFESRRQANLNSHPRNCDDRRWCAPAVTHFKVRKSAAPK